MRNTTSKTLRNISFILLAGMLLVVTVVSFATYKTDPNRSKFMEFLAGHHMEIMAASVLIALIFGFVLSKLYYAEIQKEQQETRNVLGIVMQFLNSEEPAIISHLVEHRGITSQAEISRLPHMSRVKAHRSLQKMQEKQLIEIVAHGKIRKVHLKGNILEMLLEKK